MVLDLVVRGEQEGLAEDDGERAAALEGQEDGATAGSLLHASSDGTAGVNVFDLLEYLSCWFPASAGAPCP